MTLALMPGRGAVSVSRRGESPLRFWAWLGSGRRRPRRSARSGARRLARGASRAASAGAADRCGAIASAFPPARRRAAVASETSRVPTVTSVAPASAASYPGRAARRASSETGPARERGSRDARGSPRRRGIIMTDEAFDTIVAAMARARTRRALALALAGALAAGYALHGAAPSGGGGVAAAPQCRGKRSTCKRNGQCCSGRCRKRKGKSTGRCRCSRYLEPCRTSRDCCSLNGMPLVCASGMCQT